MMLDDYVCRVSIFWIWIVRRSESSRRAPVAVEQIFNADGLNSKIHFSWINRASHNFLKINKSLPFHFTSTCTAMYTNKIPENGTRAPTIPLCHVYCE